MLCYFIHFLIIWNHSLRRTFLLPSYRQVSYTVRSSRWGDNFNFSGEEKNRERERISRPDMIALFFIFVVKKSISILPAWKIRLVQRELYFPFPSLPCVPNRACRWFSSTVAGLIPIRYHPMLSALCPWNCAILI
jgi:hypothetical protein